MAEDAKKMAVKEEKYDPGYEAAYGGAYCDRAPYESEQCNFSSNGTGRVRCLGHLVCKPLLMNEYLVVSTAFLKLHFIIFVCFSSRQSTVL